MSVVAVIVAIVPVLVVVVEFLALVAPEGIAEVHGDWVLAVVVVERAATDEMARVVVWAVVL